MKNYKDRKVGVAHYGENRIIFTPDEAAAGSIDSVAGVFKLSLLSDGSFEGVAVPKRIRHRPKLLRKTSHGRLSYTHDNTYLLTIKISVDENIDVPEVLMREAHEAAMALSS